MSGKSSESDRVEEFAGWLAARSDDQLITLLTLRPDAAGQLPTRFSALADRLAAPASVARSGYEFDALTLAVIELLAGEPAPGSVTEVVAALAGRADPVRIGERIELLRSMALVWGPDTELHPARHLAAALPWRTPQLTGPQPDGDAVGAALVRASAEQRELLGRLADGPSVGRSAGAADDAPPDHPVVGLLASGLLRRLDEQTVELPLRVRAAVRGDPEPPARELAPPEAIGTVVPDADGAGATAALELLRQTDDVLEVLGDVPAARLRAGGIGVRELRRVAKTARVPQDRAALVLELLAGAGLIAEGYPPAGDAPMFAPTVTVETWRRADPRERWADLATAWLRLRRRPEAVGQRTEEGVAGPLHPAGRSTTAPADRLRVLDALAAAAPSVAPDPDRRQGAVWFARPAQQRRLDAAAITEVVVQAQELGLVTAGALTTAGRALLAGDDPRAAMRAALPEPVTEFLLQADLTVTVPGPPDVEFGAALAEVAELESAGGAAVYRVSEASVRRALDAGRSPTEVRAFFAAHAVTDVPPALSYLIDDVARRHGRLRAGPASAFLRSDDAALLAEVAASAVAADLGLRLIAPTVLVASTPLAESVTALRAAGFAVAAEDGAGAVLDLRREPIRLPARPVTTPAAVRSREIAEQTRLRAAIGSLRRRAEAEAGADRAADLLPTLASAIEDRLRVWIDYVDAAGATVRAQVVPVALGQGRLVAEQDGLPRRFPLHRITGVGPA